MTIAELLSKALQVKDHRNFKKNWTHELIGGLFEDIVSFLTKAGTTKTANYTVLDTDQCIYVDSSGGAFTITLEASPSTNKEIEIIDSVGSCGTNNVTVDGNGNNVVGSTTALMNGNYIAFVLKYNGTQWNLK